MRFYTLPPTREIEYPYLLVNYKNYKELYKRRGWKHAILDCGVEFFKHNPDKSDYPKWFLREWKALCPYLTSIFGDKLACVIPDYPDDYHPGQFGGGMRNVEKTLRNVEEFITVDGVNWMVVIQSPYLNRLGFMESLQRTRDLIGDYPLIGVGTVCKTRKLSFIEFCLKATRRFFPKSHIHAFGLTLNALPRIKENIDSYDSLVPSNLTGPKSMEKWEGLRRILNSWDSLSYTFPREPHKPSAKTKEYAITFFYAYLKRIEEILGGKIDEEEI